MFFAESLVETLVRLRGRRPRFAGSIGASSVAFRGITSDPVTAIQAVTGSADLAESWIPAEMCTSLGRRHEQRPRMDPGRDRHLNRANSVCRSRDFGCTSLDLRPDRSPYGCASCAV